MDSPAESNADRDEDRNEILINALAEGPTHQAVGDRIGRSARTVRRLAAESEVKRRVDERRHEMALNAARRSAALVEGALQVFEELLRDSSATVRLQAANAALRYHFRFAAEVAVLEDIEELREALQQLRKRGGPEIEA
jgi:hypothetical protein